MRARIAANQSDDLQVSWADAYDETTPLLDAGRTPEVARGTMTPTPTPAFSVSSIDDLASALRGYDCVVPERAERRTNDHVERYSVVRLVGTLDWALTDFSMQLLKMERPDFLLDCNGRTIGIEHTETMTENAGKEAFLRSKGHGPESYFPRPMVIGEARKSSQRMIEEIEADKMGTGWYGDSV